MIAAIGEFPTETIRRELEMLTNRVITDRDVEFCRSLAVQNARYEVKCWKEMEERIAGEMAEWDAAEAVA